MKKVFLMVVLTLLAWSSAYGGNSVGEVIAIRGKAWIVPASTGAQEELHRKQQVFEGDQIITGENSYVKIFLIDDSVLTIAHNSRFVVTKFILSNNSRISIFNLIEGKIKAVVSKFLRKGAENRVLINTPTAVAGVRGTEFFVSTNGKVTTVDVLDGVVEVQDRNGMGKVLLGSGFSTMVRFGAPPLAPRPLKLQQIRKLKKMFFTGSAKGKELKEARKESLKIGEKSFKVLRKEIRKPNLVKIRRKMRNQKPPIDTSLSLGNNALVHVRVVFPK